MAARKEKRHYPMVKAKRAALQRLFEVMSDTYRHGVISISSWEEDGSAIFLLQSPTGPIRRRLTYHYNETGHALVEVKKSNDDWVMVSPKPRAVMAIILHG